MKDQHPSGPIPPSSTSAKAPPIVHVCLREKLGYACGDVACVLYIGTFSQFLMYFYTDVFGLLPGAVGTMFLITRLLDAINDPLMGIISDRTRSRFGKFRPWLIWGILPYVILGILTFYVPDLSQGGKLIYAYVTYVGVTLIYTMINIPYGALMGVMTPNSAERTLLASFRFYGAYIGVFTVNLTLLNFVSYFGGGDDQKGFLVTISIYAGLAAILLFITFISTKERVKPAAGQTLDIRKDLSDLLHNKPWLIVLGIGVFTMMWFTLRSTAIIYFMTYYVGAEEDLTTFFLTAGTVSTLLGVATTGLWTRFLGGKRWTMIILSVLACIGGIGFYFGNAEGASYALDVNILPWKGPLEFSLTLSPILKYLLAVHLIERFLTGPLLPLFWSMIADTADYAEWKFHRRSTGLVFSAGTFSHKTGMAVGSAFAGWFLAWFGYQANVQQSAESIEGIKNLMSFIPSAFCLLCAGVTLLYTITPEVEKQMERDLSERKLKEGTLEAD